MKIISDLIDNMDNEIELAKIYAQNYLAYNADNNREWADNFRKMAKECVDHSDKIHDLAIITIDKMSKTYNPPEEMERIWKKQHTRYIDVANWIMDMIK